MKAGMSLVLVVAALAARRLARAACSLRSKSDFKVFSVHRFSIRSGLAVAIAIAVIGGCRGGDLSRSTSAWMRG
jgi:hypothetical protein